MLDSEQLQKEVLKLKELSTVDVVGEGYAILIKANIVRTPEGIRLRAVLSELLRRMRDG